MGEILTAGALVEFGKRVIDLGDQLETAAQRAGVSGQAFSELAYAAKQNGVGVDQLQQALSKMNKAMSEAGTGAKLPTNALTALGLSFNDLKKLAPEQQLEVIADRISKLQSPADRSRAEIELFGRSGAELGPLFAQGAAGIEKLREEAQKVGASFSDETLKNLEEAHKAIDRMESSFSGLAATLVGKVSPALARFFDDITAIISGDKSHFAAGNVARIENVLAGLDPNNSGIFGKAGTGNLYARTQLIQQLHAAEVPSFNTLRESDLQSPDIAKTLDALLGTGAAPPGYKPAFDFESLMVHPLAQKLSTTEEDPFADLFRRWDDETKTVGEKAGHEVATTLARLDAALASGTIGQAEYNRRWNEINDSIQEVNVTGVHMIPILSEISQAWSNVTDDIMSAMDRTVHESGSFGKNLLRNILTALEDRAIFNAIEAIGNALYDALNKTKVGSGVASFLIDTFGGGKASGGPVSAGTTYLVGEKGPELFTPSGGGSITPNGAYGGMITHAPTYNIDARGADADRIMAIMPSLLAQSAAKAKRDLLDAFSRAQLPAPRSA